MIVFASDLDNTLIFSYKKRQQCQNPTICVETKEGKELSFMTKKAYDKLQAVASSLIFVPITTRSVEQYERITFFEKKYPQYALTTNGGILLYENQIEKNWLFETKQMIESSEKELEKAKEILKKDMAICFEIRKVDDIFIYTKSMEPEKTAKILSQQLDLEKVFVDTNGEKIYVFPKILSKGLAIKRLKNFLQCDTIFSAGDSGFDISMLEEADISYWSGKEKVMMKKGICHVYQQNVTNFAEYILTEIEKQDSKI